MTDLKALLILEDGSFWKGRGFGFPRKVFGEVVFNTGMVGYPEAFTDPSYLNQILVMTYPLIGNYGVPELTYDEYGLPIGFESEKIQISGLVVQEACEIPSHPSSKYSIHEWLFRQGIPAIQDVDTREITKRLRNKGVMMGALVVSEDEINEDEIYAELKKAEKYDAKFIAPPKIEPKFYGEKGPLVAFIDCGAKASIIRNVLNRGFRIIRLPYDTDFDELLSYNPKGVIVSNGPGNPKKFTKTIELIKNIIGSRIPTLGICLGNQLIALSYGANTFKMKYGHRGQNKPCVNLQENRVYITSQNHGYAVDPDSLKDKTLKIWWINADDSTIEGLIDLERNVISVQFHPEANPGPYDTLFVFEIFKKIVEKVDYHA
jgi:carbamoyl-phosphate synthase small subunit